MAAQCVIIDLKLCQERNERRQMVENIKQAEKEKKITQDERKKAEMEAERLTDTCIKKIDELLKKKEDEVMQV